MYDDDVFAVIRAAIGFALVAAAVAKLWSITDPARFAMDLLHVTETTARRAVVVVSTIEGLLGVLLVVGVATTGAATLTTLLVGAFVVAQVWHVRKGGEAGCSCFGVLDEHLSSRVALMRATVLFLSSAALAVAALQHSASSTRAPGATLLGGAVAFALLLAFAEIGAIGGFRRRVRAATNNATGA